MKMHCFWMILQKLIFRGNKGVQLLKLEQSQGFKVLILNRIQDLNTCLKKNLYTNMQKNILSVTEEDKLLKIKLLLQIVQVQADMYLKHAQIHLKNRTSPDGPCQKPEEQEMIESVQIEIKPTILDLLLAAKLIQRIEQDKKHILVQAIEPRLTNLEHLKTKCKEVQA